MIKDDERIYKPGEPWESFPPTAADERRIKHYEHNRQLFKGRHVDVFAKAREWLNAKPGKEKRLYIAVNFCKLVSVLIADLLFSEPVRIVVPNNRDVQGRLRDMMSDTGLQPTLHESALSGSYRGGAVLKAGWKTRKGSSIVCVPNQNYFPHPDPDDQRSLLGATIAWIRKEGSTHYLRREIHTPGRVNQELWEMDGVTPKKQVPLETLGIDVPEELNTDCDGLLVEYIPNTRLDDEFWGESDYCAIEDLIQAMNERLSHLHRVLDVHTEPVLVLPPGVMQRVPGSRERYEYKKTEETAIQAPDKSVADVVRYVTWDAQLEAAFKEVDKILDSLMICAEISPDMFGMGKGGYAESGRALKMRWARQLAKRQRREMAYDPALRRLLRCAAVLDNKFGTGPAIKDSDKISLLWGDGLPNDPRETAEEESILIAAGVTSRLSSHMRIFQVEEDEARLEMARIAEEQQSGIDSFLSATGDDDDASTGETGDE